MDLSVKAASRCQWQGGLLAACIHMLCVQKCVHSTSAIDVRGLLTWLDRSAPLPLAVLSPVWCNAVPRTQTGQTMWVLTKTISHRLLWDPRHPHF